jgi:hypothetical protein
MPETLLVFKEPNNMNNPVNRYTCINVGTKEVKANTVVLSAFEVELSGLNQPETNTYKNKMAMIFTNRFFTKANKMELNNAKTKSLSKRFIFTK